jgi:hypothetical protein
MFVGYDTSNQWRVNKQMIFKCVEEWIEIGKIAVG